MYSEYLWVVVCSGILAVVVAFGIGANDAANAFGSSVTAGALSTRRAVLLAAGCELLGALLLGASVTATVRSDITRAAAYAATPDLLMYGMMCALLATAIWLLLATYWELPVSSTHAAVSAVVGMSLVARGGGSVLWSATSDSFPYLRGMSAILLGWCLAPPAAGAAAAALFLITRHAVLRRQNSFEVALWLLPAFVGAAAWAVAFSVLRFGVRAAGWADIAAGTAAWIAAVVAAAAAAAAATAGIQRVRFLVRQDVEEEEKRRELELVALEAAAAENGGGGGGSGGGAAAARPRCSTPPPPPPDPDPDADVASTSAAAGATPAMLASMRASKVWGALTPGGEEIDIVQHPGGAAAGGGGGGPEGGPQGPGALHPLHHPHAEVFDLRAELSIKYLQVCTACLGAFAHGANDVANAAGPLAAVYAAYACACAPAAPPLPAWTLALGGAGVAAGLGAAGGRVLRVLGPKMTRLSHARGLCVESAAAAVVLLGSCMGLPLSTTHCMWGAVTGLGLLEGAKGFNHRIVLKIFLSWVATVAAVGLTAAAFAAQGMWAPNRAASDREAAQGAAVGAAAAALAGALAGRQPGELPGGAGGAAQQAPLQALQAAVGMVLADPTCAWE